MNEYRGVKSKRRVWELANFKTIDQEILIYSDFLKVGNIIAEMIIIDLCLMILISLNF